MNSLPVTWQAEVAVGLASRLKTQREVKALKIQKCRRPSSLLEAKADSHGRLLTHMVLVF